MVKSVKNAKAICAKINLPSNYSKNDHLLNRKSNVVMDKKQISKSEQVLYMSKEYIRDFSGIHINKLEFGDYVYNSTLTKGLGYVVKCIADVNNNLQSFHKSAILACNTLARIDRMEYFMRDAFKEFRPEIHEILSNFSYFIEGVQKYQNNMWFDSAHSFYNYLKLKHEFFNFKHWIRSFERAWYLAITNIWGKNGIYLPVNALNYVYEDANITEEEGFDPYYEMLYYVKQIDLQEIGKFFIKISLIPITSSLYIILKSHHGFIIVENFIQSESISILLPRTK